VHRLGLRCGWVLANAGCAMMMCVVGRGGCARRCRGWWGLRGAGRGAALRADNQIRADGAASLAPSLGRMTQLTSLNLCSTLRASAGLALWVGACERRQCGWMILCVAGRGGCALGCSGWWGLRGASRRAAVRAGNRIGAAGAASLAPSLLIMTQLTSLDLSGTLRASAGLALFAGDCERRQCADDVACCGPRRLCAGL
jgi:hypothetical protein